ncbi:DUF6708 domain-containing protein [Rugamonas aquatica]|uniref:DUF6708 domain-containing protein n=1 Tax=Rugamonas aquatica TaxID=2743357 RepID=A0A6A7MZG3_9BURK|nr:DUF6708 domain-containing protein [Rugamonas aquatica]MQA38127.1 hypothetical protein [Rugamonas aquatica]
MEFSGLITKYRAHRALTDQERAHQLKQQVRANVEPHYQLSVIKMNSTYLESVDKWFAWKGMITAITLVIIGMCAALFFAMVHLALTRPPDFHGETDDATLLTIVGVIMLPLLAAAGWLLLKESFAYTHYPMRFNRKTRMVHVFRPDGTVLTVPWDKLFFTLGHMAQWDEWEVRGHVLAPDQETVQESFALSYVGSLNANDINPARAYSSVEDYVRGHWEFIRRYMEDGPQAVAGQVQFCMPIAERRESFRVGAERVFANIASANVVLYCLLFPVCLVVSLFRFVAMRTSKIPQWPQEVEVGSVLEPGDPHAIEGDPAGERMASARTRR